MMWRVKQLADPDGDPGARASSSTATPACTCATSSRRPRSRRSATKCIECGFCEPVCPSRNLTTTPRQRIVLRREMARQAAGSPVLDALLEQYEYDAIETCAADGSCMLACPVAIDTGKLVKELRAPRARPRAERAAASSVATPLRSWSSARPARARPRRRRWPRRPRAAAVRRSREAAPARPAAVHASARGPRRCTCPRASTGSSATPRGAGRAPVAARGAGRRLGARRAAAVDPATTSPGHCCGTPWSSKGYERGHELMAPRTRDALGPLERRRQAAGRDRRELVHARRCVAEVATRGGRGRSTRSRGSTTGCSSGSRSRASCASVVVHPTCSSRHLGLSAQARGDRRAARRRRRHPGDERLLRDGGRPRLPAPGAARVGAPRRRRASSTGRSFDACVSSNRTCEVALQQVTGRPYESFVLALEALTRG